MTHNKIQQTVINKLLDKYEKSKTFTGTNQVTQTFDKKIAELFPKYNDDAEYEFFCEVNDALNELKKADLVGLQMQRGNILSRVSLNVSMINECYSYVNREPKKDEQKWLIEAMEQFKGCSVLEKYFKIQRIKIAKNQRVEYFDGDKKEYLDLLKLVNELTENEEEHYIRDFSIKQFRDSKRVEKLSFKAQALMYQYGEYQDRESVFEECGVVRTPTYVCIKGQGILRLGTQILDLSKLRGDIALSTHSLRELDEIQVIGKRVVTVENLTSFHDYEASDDFVVYLGGFHNKVKRKFLIFLYERNPDKEYRHFGDIDAGGFYILEHLKAKTGIRFRSMYMDIETLCKHITQTKQLTQNDKKRIKSLLLRFEEVENGYDLSEDYSKVLEFMLAHDCKLEQEAVIVD